jgi:hypothetical protein
MLYIPHKELIKVVIARLNSKGSITLKDDKTGDTVKVKHIAVLADGTLCPLFDGYVFGLRCIYLDIYGDLHIAQDAGGTVDTTAGIESGAVAYNINVVVANKMWRYASRSTIVDILGKVVPLTGSQLRDLIVKVSNNHLFDDNKKLEVVNR